MQYTPPNSDEAKKATFLYFMLLLVAVIAINAISVLNSGERMSYEGRQYMLLFLVSALT